MTSVLQFIQDVKFEYFKWLKENESSFPYCCYISSEVLGSFIQERFKAGKVCLGMKNKCNRFNNFHEWIEIGDYVIDFTRFQYSGRNRRRRYASHTAEEAFEICINSIQEDVIFPASEFYTEFTKKLELTPRYKALVKNRAFDEYLKRVLKSKKFIDFNFWDNIPQSERYWEKDVI